MIVASSTIEYQQVRIIQNTTDTQRVCFVANIFAIISTDPTEADPCGNIINVGLSMALVTSLVYCIRSALYIHIPDVRVSCRSHRKTTRPTALPRHRYQHQQSQQLADTDFAFFRCFRLRYRTGVLVHHSSHLAANQNSSSINTFNVEHNSCRDYCPLQTGPTGALPNSIVSSMVTKKRKWLFGYVLPGEKTDTGSSGQSYASIEHVCRQVHASLYIAYM